MRNLLLFTLYFLVSFSYAQQPVRQESHTDGPVKIMSYNVRYDNAHDGKRKWEFRKSEVAAIINLYAPDVIGTQEGLHHQVHDLDSMVQGYAVFGAGRDDGKEGGEYVAIFYKEDRFTLLDGGNFWLSETPAIAGSKGWDAADVRMVSWCKLQDKTSNAVYFIFNTHYDYKGVVAKQKSSILIKKMMDSIAGNEPVILCGDFNSSIHDCPCEMLTSSKSKPLLSEAGMMMNNKEGTFAEQFKVKKKLRTRLDYIFFSHHFTTQSYKVISDHTGRFYPSDHKPILADLLLQH